MAGIYSRAVGLSLSKDPVPDNPASDDKPKFSGRNLSIIAETKKREITNRIWPRTGALSHEELAKWLDSVNDHIHFLFASSFWAENNQKPLKLNWWTNIPERLATAAVEIEHRSEFWRASNYAKPMDSLRGLFDLHSPYKLLHFQLPHLRLALATNKHREFDVFFTRCLQNLSDKNYSVAVLEAAILLELTVSRGVKRHVLMQQRADFEHSMKLGFESALRLCWSLLPDCRGDANLKKLITLVGWRDNLVHGGELLDRKPREDVVEVISPALAYAGRVYEWTEKQGQFELLRSAFMAAAKELGLELDSERGFRLIAPFLASCRVVALHKHSVRPPAVFAALQQAYESTFPNLRPDESLLMYFFDRAPGKCFFCEYGVVGERPLTKKELDEIDQTIQIRQLFNFNRKSEVTG